MTVVWFCVKWEQDIVSPTRVRDARDTNKTIPCMLRAEIVLADVPHHLHRLSSPHRWVMTSNRLTQLVRANYEMNFFIDYMNEAILWKSNWLYT